MKFSIVIPTLNRAESLKRTICAIIDNIGTRNDDAELIVVDNGSTDHTRVIVTNLQKKIAGLKYVYQPKSGIHHAVNTGVLAASNQIIVISDDDLLFENHFFRNIVRVYEDHSIWCAGGKVIPKWEDERPGWIPEDESSLGYLDYGSEMRVLKWPETIFGANFSFRRDRFIEVGGWNPDRFTGGDGETGFCRKVYKHGGKIIYVPDAVSYHLVSAKHITHEFMKNRYAQQARCASYAQYQDNLYTQKELFKKVCHSLILFFKILLKKIKLSILHSDNNFNYHKNQWRIAYLKSQIRYDLRLLLNKDFRKFVLKTNWLDEVRDI